MKLEQIYRTAVQKGITEDKRDSAEIDRVLAATKTGYDKLDDEDRRFFDEERLKNPYSDTRINVGDPDLGSCGCENF